MNTKEYVKLVSDSSYIPVKYMIMEASIGSTLGGSYVWLLCVSNGIASKANLDTFIESVESPGAPDKSLLLGTVKTYSIETLATVAQYNAPTSYEGASVTIG